MQMDIKQLERKVKEGGKRRGMRTGEVEKRRTTFDKEVDGKNTS